jgi:hypothetical protein
MGFHKDEHMRGKHLVDTKTGELWPWTVTLSKKPGFVPAEEPDHYVATHAVAKAPKLKLPKIEMPPPVEVPEDASIADAIKIYTHEAGKKVK